MNHSVPPIRVLVVDDSSVARRVIAQALESDLDIVVQDTACDGIKALEALDKQEFDLVMMDVEMPRLDGISALKEIRKRDRFLPVILFSALSHHGATATIEGLANGANDYCAKPSSTSGPEQAVRAIREELVPRIRVHTANARKRRNRSASVGNPPQSRPAGSSSTKQLPLAPRDRTKSGGAFRTGYSAESVVPSPKPDLEDSPRGQTVPKQATPAPNLPASGHPSGVRRAGVGKKFTPLLRASHVTPKGAGGNKARPAALPNRPIPKARVAIIGSSTGGPQALLELVKALPGDYPLPLVVVQHMPKTFTNVLAARLDSLGSINVHEAEEGEPLQQGTMLFAPGGMHLEIVARGQRLFAHLNQDAMVNSCRPSVDVTLDSAHKACGGDVLVSILTGMGRDGANGCTKLSQAGAHIIAQDEESCVVWGMPGAVVQAGVADRVLPLSEIPNALTQAARRAKGSRRNIA